MAVESPVAGFHWTGWPTRYNYGAGGHAGYQLYDLQRLKADAHALVADPTAQLETQDATGFEATCDETFY